MWNSLFTATFNNKQKVLVLMSLLDLRACFGGYKLIVRWKFYGLANTDQPPLVQVQSLGSRDAAIDRPENVYL